MKVPWSGFYLDTRHLKWHVFKWGQSSWITSCHSGVTAMFEWKCCVLLSIFIVFFWQDTHGLVLSVSLPLNKTLSSFNCKTSNSNNVWWTNARSSLVRVRVLIFLGVFQKVLNDFSTSCLIYLIHVVLIKVWQLWPIIDLSGRSDLTWVTRL